MSTRTKSLDQPAIRAQIVASIADGDTTEQAAEKVGVCRLTVYRYAKADHEFEAAIASARATRADKRPAAQGRACCIATVQLTTS